MTARLSVGEEKFARLKTLKISARNWALKLSEIRRMWLFLNTEKSSFESPGPMITLRPRLPRRFAQVPGMPGFPATGGVAAGFDATNPKGWHMEAMSGVDCGRTKQLEL